MRLLLMSELFAEYRELQKGFAKNVYSRRDQDDACIAAEDLAYPLFQAFCL